MQQAAVIPPDSLGCHATDRPCRRRQGPTNVPGSPSYCTELSTARHPTINKATMTIKILDEHDEVPRFHTYSTRRLKKKHLKKKKSIIFEAQPGQEDLKIIPTMALPFIADLPAAREAPALQQTSKECAKKKKKKLRSKVVSVIHFASASLGRSLGVHDNLAARARIRALAWSAEAYRRRTSELPPSRHISLEAMTYLRDTFKVQCTKGALKRPVIHVEFDYPRSISACCACSSSDFLYVFVGLFNIFVVQVALVVIMFFAEKEIDLNSLETYYQPTVSLFQ